MFQSDSESFEFVEIENDEEDFNLNNPNGVQTKESVDPRIGFNSSDCSQELSFDAPIASGSENMSLFYSNIKDICKEEEDSITGVSINSSIEEPVSTDSEKPLVEDHNTIDKSSDSRSISRAYKYDYDSSLKDLANLYFKLLSEDNIYQNLLKKTREQKNQEGIFNSNILDEYLENHSQLTVNFDLPEHSWQKCKFLKQNLPSILKTISTSNNHSHCTQHSNIQPETLINIDKDRPFHEAKNLQKLGENVSVDDSKWENIAEYAITSDISDSEIRKYLVPVVLNSLIESFKLGNFPIKTSNPIETCLEGVLENIEKREQLTIIEPSIEEKELTASSFEFNKSTNIKPIDVNPVEINSEEMLQNIEEIEDLAVFEPLIEIKELTNMGDCCFNYSKKCTRKSKKEIVQNSCSDLNYEQDNIFSSRQTSKKQKKMKLEKISKRDSDKLARIFDILNEQNPLRLADVFIWCCTHSRFSCHCSGKVLSFKLNKLIWKPSSQKPYLSFKTMSDILINNNFPNCHGFFPNNHSSRTAGSLINYRLRNSSLLFKWKRLAEIRNGVLSCSNSFIKVNSRTIMYQKSQFTGKVLKKCKPTSILKVRKTNEISIDKKSLTLYNEVGRNEEKKLSFEENNNVTLCTMKQKEKSLETEDILISKRSSGDQHTHLDGRNITLADSGRIDESKLAEYLVCNPIDTSDTVKGNDKPLFKYGLLCLTEGFGFLLVKQFTADKLLIQDPLRPNIFRCFKDLETANEWLNRLFKQHLVFESEETNLKWVVVKTGILKNSLPFDKTLIEKPSKYVNKLGILVDKHVTSFNQGMETVETM